MVDLIHWELQTELTKVLLYPLELNSVGLKACQRRKDCSTDVQSGSWKSKVLMMVDLRAVLIR